MHKYRATRSGITVEAVELTAANVKDVAQWCNGFEVVEHDAFQHQVTNVGLNVPTLQGRVRASEGDYIFKGMDGNFYVYGPHQFEYIFEPA